ncbi:MAG TPA: metallophosphoesterase [Kofleriaceae bacterium]
MIAYLTDVEGRWDKVESFAAGNPHVWLEGTSLRLADGVSFVFGGDSVDRGAHGRRILTMLVEARRAYGDRVVLLAGNRDINKLRLARELAGAPPAKAPVDVSRAELLRWIFSETMGAPKAFEYRRAELAAGGAAADDDAVVDSFVEDVRPGGLVLAYLQHAQLGHRAGSTLFVHGGVCRDNLFVTPDAPDVSDVEAWLAALHRFYTGELAAFVAGRPPTALIAYQAPKPGTHLNQASVVYARPTDEDGNPHLPEPEVIARLRDNGIDRVVVGHTPSGDCPAVLHDGGFELVLGDNSYARLELGSQLAFTDELTSVHATTELGGTRHAIAGEIRRGDRQGPLGRRDGDTGQLVKARLADGRYLLFRGLPGHQVEQLPTPADELARRRLVLAT